MLKKNDDNTDSQTVPSTHDGWVGNRLSQRPAFPLHRAIDSLWKRCCVDSAGGEPNLWPTRRTLSAIVGVWFGACAKFVFLALSILYPNDRLSGFAMATKTCRAAIKAVPEAIKFDEKPICVKIDL